LPRTAFGDKRLDELISTIHQRNRNVTQHRYHRKLACGGSFAPEFLMTEKSRSMIRGNGNQPLASWSPGWWQPEHYYLSNLPVDVDRLAG